MRIIKKYAKVIAFDVLAGLCFIGVVLFGWLPGPGGIPLFLLGLSLLAVNHDWAERWLETAKHHGVTFKKWLFPNNQIVRYTYDFLSFAIILIGGFLLINSDERLVSAASVIMICGALFLFLLNRDRFDKMSDIFKKTKK